MSYGLTFDDGTTNSWKNSEVDVSGNLYRETNYSFTLGVGEYINKVWGSGQVDGDELVHQYLTPPSPPAGHSVRATEQRGEELVLAIRNHIQD